VGCMAAAFLLAQPAANAQDSTTTEQVTEEQTVQPRKPKPVKNTFESIWIIDNQSVMVPAKKTFEMDIMHRFGTMKNKYNDLYGFFAPSNIKLGFSYVIRNNLMIGAGITKEGMIWDGTVKYSLLKQTRELMPVSVTYFGNMGIKTRDGEYRYFTDRIGFFNQVMIARKINEKASIQIAPSVSHVNVMNGLYKKEGIKGSAGQDSTVTSVISEMKHNHWAIAFSGRYKVTQSMAILVNYDQPITKHPSQNPDPNFSFGIEVGTSSHAFQFFLGNYYFINPQMNNMYNQNNPAVPFKEKYKQFLIGFNITRLWSY
jgi:hypothetical protein